MVPAKANIAPINWPEMRNTFDDVSNKWASLRSDMPIHPSYRWWCIYSRNLREYSSSDSLFALRLMISLDMIKKFNNVYKQYTSFAGPSFVSYQREKSQRLALDFRPLQLWPVAYVSAYRPHTPKNNWTMHWMWSMRLAKILDWSIRESHATQHQLNTNILADVFATVKFRMRVMWISLSVIVVLKSNTNTISLRS